MNIHYNLFISNKLRKLLNEKEEFKLSLREVSRHLRDFEERGLVECLNKEDPYNKLYQITQKGKILRGKLVKIEI